MSIRKLTLAQVDEIRLRLMTGERQFKLAKEYGVHKSTIYKAQLNGYALGYVPAPPMNPDTVNEASWQKLGKCAGLSALEADEIFYAEGGGYIAAKAMCHRCPVERQCYDFATKNQIRYGVFGGEGGAERIKRLGIGQFDTDVDIPQNLFVGNADRGRDDKDSVPDDYYSVDLDPLDLEEVNAEVA